MCACVFFGGGLSRRKSSKVKEREWGAKGVCERANIGGSCLCAMVFVRVCVCVSAEGRAKKKEKGSERGRGVSERANSCWERYLRV